VEPAIQGIRLMGINIIYLSASIFTGMGFLSEISRQAALALQIIANSPNYC
jgi:hypothetical protein